MLARTAAPLTADMLSVSFRGKDLARQRTSVEKALETLAAAATAQRATARPGGESRYFFPR